MGTDGRRGGRRRKLAIAALGLAAVAVGATFALLKAVGRTEADLLLDLMVSGDRADAAWAFERLKAIAPSAIDDLIGRVDDPSPTVLEHVEWSHDDGSMSIFGRPLEVQGIVRLILRCELKVRDRDPLGALRRPPEQASPDLLEAIGRRRASVVERTLRYLRRIVSPSPRIVPPSRDPSMARLRSEGDASALLDLVRGDDLAVASWSLESLRALPDDRLTALLPLASSEEPTGIRTLAWRDRIRGVSGGNTVGTVVRNVLEERLGWGIDPFAESRSQPTGLTLDDLGLLEAAWKRKLEGKDPGPPPGGEP